MAGRIEIDDVAPVVSGGRYPGQGRGRRGGARSRRRCGARATTPSPPRWSCGITAPRYPRLADGARRASPSRTSRRCRSTRSWARPRRSSVNCCRWRRDARPTCSTASSPPTPSGCGRSAWTAGATRSRPGARTSPPSSRPARARPNCPTTCWWVRSCSNAPRRACRVRTAIPLIDAAARLREPGDPFARAGAALSPEVARPAARRIRCANWSPAVQQYGVWVDRPLARFSAWYEMFPRSTGGWDGKGNAVHGTFATASKALPRIAKMGFDIVYLPPIHPIGKVHRKGRNNSVTAAPKDVGSPWAIGSRRGRPRRRPSQARHHRGLRRLRRRGARRGPRGRPRPGAAVRTRSPVGQGPSRVVHRAARRHHRLRGEPAEEVPGHLSGQLRQRSGRHLPGGAARRPILDLARRQGLPGRQSAHQAAELLGVADRRGEERRSRRAVPGRGVHPARAVVRAGQARFHAVLHVLHLAHREVGAHRVRRADRRARRLLPARTCGSNTPGHPAREPAARRARACSRSAR